MDEPTPGSRAALRAPSPEAYELMRGAVDTHVHSAPDPVPRKLDDYELARQARERGMAAVVLKNHFLATALRAALVETQVPGIRVVGSVVLNQPMGGINPWAVEAAARAGAKVVWFPTAQSEHQLAYQSRPGNPPHRAGLQLGDRDPAVRVFGADGEPTADTLAVLEIIRDRDLVLATGHLSPDEVDRLSARAQAMGVRKIVQTHPDLAVISMPIELQRRLAERGVRFERTFNVVVGSEARLSMSELAARIRAVGFESTILATDLGQPDNPLPAEGYALYLQGLLDHGFTPAEIRRMASENAREWLGV